MPPKSRQKLTNAQKQANYRARRDLDPERRQAYLEAKQKKYREDVAKGKRKHVKDLSDRELRQQRKIWKLNQQKHRKAMKNCEVSANQMTPPHSPDGSPDIPQLHSRQNLCGRKKIAKDRAKCYRDKKRLEEQLSLERKRAERYRKRYERLLQSTDANVVKHGMSPRSKTKKLLQFFEKRPKNNPVARTLTFHFALLDGIKKRYQLAKSNKERVMIRKHLVGLQVLRKYKIQKWAARQLPMAYRRWQFDPFTKENRRQSNSNHKISLVKEFFCRDDVSRMTTGKSNTITKNKMKMQRRLLTDTLNNLHTKFIAEHTEKVSYSYFCSLRPFWVMEPTDSDRETCQCKFHENSKFMADRLFSLKFIETNNFEQLVSQIVCDPNSKYCAYSECTMCKNKTCDFKSPDTTSLSHCVSYPQWILKKVPRVSTDDNNASTDDTITVTRKEKVETDVSSLMSNFSTILVNLKRHLFNIKKQYQVYKDVREHMLPNACMIHVDFSENYTCKYANETQSLHFGGSHEQSTLHTGVLYAGDETIPFCTISKSRQHDPPAIWAHLSPILVMIRVKYSQVTTLHIYSDGPATQYKQKTNFFLLSTEPYKMGFQTVSWHFFEASHGKGAPDGIGGALKRTADRLVRLGKDIPDSETLYNMLLQHTSVYLKCISCSKISSYNEYVKGLGAIPTLKGTMRIHQIISLKPSHIKYRDVSCICRLDQDQTLDCNCFEPVAYEYKITNANDADVEIVDSHEEVLQQPQGKLNRPDSFTKDYVGQYCIVLYDDKLYPGEIVDIVVSDDNEKTVKVKCMNSMGRNRSYWKSGRADVNEYLEEDIVCLIDEPPKTSKRYTSIAEDIWNDIEELYGKINI